MNEMSIESLMVVGTGLVAPKSAETKTFDISYDGYSDGLDMDLTRTSEQLHFVDTYNELQALHSAEKLKMIKKIQTAYKNIGNTNVSNSVELYCNNAMSTEGIITNIKEKLVEIFKKFCEFIKKCIMKFRMNAAKHVGLFKTVNTGFFIEESEKFINILYKKNSELIAKISHASQLDDDMYQHYLLLKSISNNMIQNCFNIFLIGVHDSKLQYKTQKIKNDTRIVYSFYNPQGLHAKLKELLRKYSMFIRDLFDNIEDTTFRNTSLSELNSSIQDDAETIRLAAECFKDLSIEAYDLSEITMKIYYSISENPNTKTTIRFKDIQQQAKQYYDDLREIFSKFEHQFEMALKSGADPEKAGTNMQNQQLKEMCKLANKQIKVLRQKYGTASVLFSHLLPTLKPDVQPHLIQ